MPRSDREKFSFLIFMERPRKEGDNLIQNRALMILNNIEMQNMLSAKTLKIPFADIEKRLNMKGDEWPNAAGDFGTTPTNPILANGPIGEVAYLSRLMQGGRRMAFFKVGSTADCLDLFRAFTLDGLYATNLYLDMYHKHQSRFAPAHCMLMPKCDGITGITSSVKNVADFIEGLKLFSVRNFSQSAISPAIKIMDKDAIEKNIFLND